MALQLGKSQLEINGWENKYAFCVLDVNHILDYKIPLTIKLLPQNLPSYFPEDCIMSFFVICGVVISSSASWRNPFLSVLPWGFPQELALEIEY